MNLVSYSQSKLEQLTQIEKFKKLKVKTVSLYEYSYSFSGERKKDGYLSEKIEYDNKGRKIEQKIYYSDGNLASKAKFAYDVSNIVVRENWEDVGGGGHRVFHHYDNQGYLIKSEQYSEYSNLEGTIEYNYNTDGKMEKIKHNFGDEFSYLYKYDYMDNLVEEIFIPMKKDLRKEQKTIYTYDERGLIIETNTIDTIGDKVKTNLYKYKFYK